MLVPAGIRLTHRHEFHNRSSMGLMFLNPGSQKNRTHMNRLFLSVLFLTQLSDLPAAQNGYVVFNNRIASVVSTRVYFSADVHVQLRGNNPTDFPSGTSDWSGFNAITGSGFMASIMAANGIGQPEESLTFGANPTTTTFRAGANAGGFAPTLAYLANVAPDAPAATVEVFAWDSNGGTITDPTLALAMFRAGEIAGGLSGILELHDIGGAFNTPPNLTGLQSFNIYIIPEPTLGTLMLMGLFVLSRTVVNCKPR
jgi:hypothetical protein